LKKNAIDEAVGSQITSRRMMLHLTVEQLAETLAISHDDLAAYECGEKHVDAALLLTLSRVLDVSLSFFYEALKDRDKRNDS